MKSTLIAFAGCFVVSIATLESEVFPDKRSEVIADMIIYLLAGGTLGLVISEESKRDKFKMQIANQISKRINQSMSDKRSVDPLDVLAVLEEIKEEL